MMFKIKLINADKISGRIGSIYPHYLNGRDSQGRCVNRRKGNGRNMHLIWDKVVKAGKCPWITPEYDEYLLRLYPEKRVRKRVLRLGSWYQVLKTGIYAKSKRSAEKRKRRLAEEDAAESII